MGSDIPRFPTKAKKIGAVTIAAVSRGIITISDAIWSGVRYASTGKRSVASTWWVPSGSVLDEAIHTRTASYALLATSIPRFQSLSGAWEFSLVQRTRPKTH